MGDATVQRIEVRTPGRWPLWHIERYTQFMDTLERVGCTERFTVLRWRHRAPQTIHGEIRKGTRLGSNFFG